MALFRTLSYFIFTLLIVSSFFSEAEGRRKILKGRKTVTREYYKAPVLPAWVKILLSAFGMVLGGAALYGILWKFLVSDLK